MDPCYSRVRARLRGLQQQKDRGRPQGPEVASSLGWGECGSFGAVPNGPMVRSEPIHRRMASGRELLASQSFPVAPSQLQSRLQQLPPSPFNRLPLRRRQHSGVRALRPRAAESRKSLRRPASTLPINRRLSRGPPTSHRRPGRDLRMVQSAPRSSTCEHRTREPFQAAHAN